MVSSRARAFQLGWRLQQRALADLARSSQGVDTGLAVGESVEQRALPDQWLVGETPEVGVLTQEGGQAVHVRIVGEESSVHVYSIVTE